MLLRFLEYILSHMEDKCPKCNERNDRCICNNCQACDQYNCICTDEETEYEDRLARCARCNTYECFCGDSDFEESLICSDCGWSVKIIGGIKIDCVCKSQ
jgi:hypothetical protein